MTKAEISKARSGRLSELRSFYEDHLYKQVLPFWLKYGVDRGERRSVYLSGG